MGNSIESSIIRDAAREYHGQDLGSRQLLDFAIIRAALDGNVEGAEIWARVFKNVAEPEAAIDPGSPAVGADGVRRSGRDERLVELERQLRAAVALAYDAARVAFPDPSCMPTPFTDAALALGDRAEAFVRRIVGRITRTRADGIDGLALKVLVLAWWMNWDCETEYPWAERKLKASIKADAERLEPGLSWPCSGGVEF